MAVEGNPGDPYVNPQGDPDATRIDPPQPLPPPPGPPPSGPPSGPRGGGPAGSGGFDPEPVSPRIPDGGQGGGGNRTKILAGIAAAVVVLGGVAVAITRSGGDDSSTASSATDTGADTGEDTGGDTGEDTGGDTGEDTGGGGAGGTTARTPEEEQLLTMISPQYRSKCEKEDKDNQEPGAIAALVCDAPRGFYLAIESYGSNADFKSAFEGYAGGAPEGNCAASWDVRQIWFYDQKDGASVNDGTPVGDLFCFTNTKDIVSTNDGNSMFWTDNSRRSIAFLIGNGGTTKGEAFGAWHELARPPA